MPHIIIQVCRSGLEFVIFLFFILHNLEELHTSEKYPAFGCPALHLDIQQPHFLYDHVNKLHHTGWDRTSKTKDIIELLHFLLNCDKKHEHLVSMNLAKELSQLEVMG